MLAKGVGKRGRLLKAWGGDGDKWGMVTTAHGRAAGARGTPAACRLEEARAGNKKERINTRGTGGGMGAAGVSCWGTPAASTWSMARRWSLGREGGRAARPRKLCQCSSVSGGSLVVPTTSCVLDEGEGQGAERGGPETHEVSSRAHEVRHEPRATPPQPQSTAQRSTQSGADWRVHTSCGVSRARHGPIVSEKGLHPLPIRSSHWVAPKDRLGGMGARRTQEATQSDRGPAHPSPHWIRLPPDVFRNKPASQWQDSIRIQYFQYFPMLSKQIVRLVAGSDQFSGVGPATLLQRSFASAHLQGLPTHFPTHGVGHSCFWKPPKGGSERTARSLTRACRDSALHDAPVQETSTDTSASVVSRETRAWEKCPKFLPPCWLWTRGATTSSDVHDSCLTIRDVCAKSARYWRDLEGSTGTRDTSTHDLLRTAAFSSGLSRHRDCFTICIKFDKLGTNVAVRASPIILSPSGDHVAPVFDNSRTAEGLFGWEKWEAAHRPPRKQTRHVLFWKSDLGGDVVGCALRCGYIRRGSATHILPTFDTHARLADAP